MRDAADGEPSADGDGTDAGTDVDAAPKTAARPPRSRRLRGGLIALAVVLVVLFLSFRGISVFYTDYLWFSSVNFQAAWRGLLAAKIGLGLVFFSIFFVLMYTSLTIADRLAPKTRTIPPLDDLASRYQASGARYAGRIRLLVSAFFAIIVGATVAVTVNTTAPLAGTSTTIGLPSVPAPVKGVPPTAVHWVSLRGLRPGRRGSERMPSSIGSGRGG